MMLTANPNVQQTLKCWQ